MIQDSGERREFESGAVRDMSEGKGRFDLVPLYEAGKLIGDEVIKYLGRYELSGDRVYLDMAMGEAIANIDKYDMMLQLAKHFENGAKKYSVDNWKRGIPTSSYIDSAVRHYCKYKSGWTDEEHLTAFVWNMICLIWTIKNKPDYIDYPR